MWQRFHTEFPLNSRNYFSPRDKLKIFTSANGKKLGNQKKHFCGLWSSLLNGYLNYLH